MTYDPNTPNADDSPANQQPQIRTNFSQFASIFSLLSGGVIYNHSALNTGNQGKHEAILMEDQLTDPVVDDEFVSLYNKDGQLFSRIQQFLPNEIPNFPVQMTFGQVDIIGPQYQSFLSGGYILYIGSSIKSTTVTLIPACTELLTVIVTPNTGTSNFGAGVTITQPNMFVINSTGFGGAYVFNFIAIGKQ